MEARSLAYAGYWRNSLADAELGRGGLSLDDVNGFLKVPTAELSVGAVSKASVDACFRDEPDKIKTVDVVIRPKVHVIRTEHGQRPVTGVPEIVTPLVTPALLARDGRLYPIQGTVVPRDLLEPLERGSYSIGTVSALDTFLTVDAVPGIDLDSAASDAIDSAQYEIGWEKYRNGCERLLAAVCPKLFADPDLEVVGYGYLVKKASVMGASRHILALYDHIRSHAPAAALFDRYAAEAMDPVEPCLPANAAFSRRLGHSSDSFALAQTQRDALNHVLEIREGEILGINGPPGTGKTTLLLSVVASLWAKAAVDETEPPIVLAASTNNQAVTNIIDAFGKDFAPSTGALAGRWLPDVKSFGAYFPAMGREAEAAEKYQTRSFFDGIETEDYVARAKEHYQRCAAAAFPDLENFTVESIVARIHRSLRIEVDMLVAIDAAWGPLAEARAAVRQQLGDSPAAALIEHRRQGELLEAAKSSGDRMLQHWEIYLARESLFYSLFAWVPPVARKRLRLARLFIKQFWPEERPPDWRTLDEIQAAVELLVLERTTAAREQALLIQRSEVLIETEQQRLHEWRAALAPLSPVLDETVPSLAQVDPVADRLIRFPIFLLTTHYWEGRWLLDMDALLKKNKEGIQELHQEKRRTGRVAADKRWRRRMKLTPCIVSTFHMLPAEMKASRHDDRGFVKDYLYDFADLLVVDEAGQVLPEVAGASFALAKRALVIGDTLQIEPIWSLPARIDIGNLLAARLIPAGDHEDAFQRLSDLGKTVSSGSVMCIAQCASRYHYDPELARGMFLYEHRRCFDEIIAYCNKLRYHGKLIPMRGAKADAVAAGEVDDGLPPMGYLHVDGICETAGDGSRYNQLEAETIAAWVAARKTDLEATYRRPLNEIVGVITPFGAQVRAITQACRRAGIAAGSQRGDMTVGTVHALQGAERAVVIFSPAYSKHADGGFIDKSPSMLNVAVSRAKNSFLVFGDMDVFQLVPRETPRGQLAALLFAAGEGLHFEYRPRRDLATPRTSISQLRDASEHDAFLLHTIANVDRELHIVTPWIRLQCMEQTGALAALAAAAGEDVKIRIYTDLGYNTDDRVATEVTRKRRELQTVVDALAALRIDALLVWRVHSKIVIADEDVYCVGSFNWFSAARDPHHARHETSLVYRGVDLVKEIEAVKTSLRLRVTRFQR